MSLLSLQLGSPCDSSQPVDCEWGVMSWLNVSVLGYEPPALFSPAIAIIEAGDAKHQVPLSHRMQDTAWRVFQIQSGLCEREK